ncbi:hypothetical protein BHM03_00029451 [Ensete ventricosum]|nr:hypothetical protein BHM03_00029451 [Ensete ventricosum]
MFDMEYGRWVDDNCKMMSELRAAVEAHLPDDGLGVVVDHCIRHYDDLFRLKAIVAQSDVFHLLNGIWKTPAERCFLWMGGFRPSELIKLRQQLTTKQAARCFLAIGEYFTRLRALSSLWASRPQESLVANDGVVPTTTDPHIIHHPLHNHFSAFS